MTIPSSDTCLSFKTVVTRWMLAVQSRHDPLVTRSLVSIVASNYTSKYITGRLSRFIFFRTRLWHAMSSSIMTRWAIMACIGIRTTLRNASKDLCQKTWWFKEFENLFSFPIGNRECHAKVIGYTQNRFGYHGARHVRILTSRTKRCQNIQQVTRQDSIDKHEVFHKANERFQQLFIMLLQDTSLGPSLTSA
jgi:hypothetical protein